MSIDMLKRLVFSTSSLILFFFENSTKSVPILLRTPLNNICILLTPPLILYFFTSSLNMKEIYGSRGCGSNSVKKKKTYSQPLSKALVIIKTIIINILKTLKIKPYNRVIQIFQWSVKTVEKEV